MVSRHSAEIDGVCFALLAVAVHPEDDKSSVESLESARHQCKGSLPSIVAVRRVLDRQQRLIDLFEEACRNHVFDFIDDESNTFNAESCLRW